MAQRWSSSPSRRPPASGGADLLEYVDGHRTIYIVQELLWLSPSLFLTVVFLALAVALRRHAKSFAAIAGPISVTSWAVSLAWQTTGDGSLVTVLLSDSHADAATGTEERPSWPGPSS